MKRLILAVIILIASLAAAAHADAMNTNESLALKNKSTLQISTFMTAGDIVQFLDTKEKLEKAVAILKPLGVTKIFLDNYRDGIIPDRKTLIQARDYLRAKGFTVSAGITTVQGKDFGMPSPTHRYFLCYDNDKTKNDIKKISEYAASMFDEIIVDDFFATDCRTPESTAKKGKQPWDQYFRDTLVGVSRDDIVGAAHSVNKKCNVIIKYPQWYDRFHVFGYDVSRQPGIFDQVWAGTETRDPEKENVMQYEAFANYTWIKSLAGKKMRGGWFDMINSSPETYVEQAYQTALAGASEITLFGFRPVLFTSADSKLFAEKLPLIFKVASSIKGIPHKGVYAYKPANSGAISEHYVFDYLGMFGIPVLPTSVYPKNAKVVILTEHAAADPDIAEKIKATANSGGTVMMSTGLIERLKKNEEILQLAGIGPTVKRMRGKYTNKYFINGSDVTGDGYIDVGVRITLNGAAAFAYAIVDNEKVPIFTERLIPGGGKIVVFDATTFSFPSDTDGLTVPSKVLYINLLDKVVSLIRNTATEPLGVTMTMPSHVGAYLYGNRYIAMDNFNDSAVDASVKFDTAKIGCEVTKLTDINDNGKSQPDKQGVTSLKIPSRSMRMFKIEYKNGCAIKRD